MDCLHQKATCLVAEAALVGVFLQSWLLVDVEAFASGVVVPPRLSWVMQLPLPVTFSSACDRENHSELICVLLRQ
jgi:hypothetical protein